MIYQISDTKQIRVTKQCHGWYQIDVYDKVGNISSRTLSTYGSNKAKIHKMIREIYNDGKNIKSSQIMR